jgi:hypothetical protein
MKVADRARFFREAWLNQWILFWDGDTLTIERLDGGHRIVQIQGENMRRTEWHKGGEMDTDLAPFDIERALAFLRHDDD